MSLILVTGANGFVGSHVAKQALESGYSVRGVVRSEDKATALKKVFPSDKFEIVVVPDITGDYTEALKGVTAIIHVASPFFIRDDIDPKSDFLDPAIEGTTSLLRAAQKAGIKRIVFTGAIGSILSKPGLLFEDANYGADDWLPFTLEQGASGKLPGAAVYFVSKKYAEKFAWDFAKEHPEMQFTVIIPGVVYGPIIHPLSSLAAVNTSNSIIYALLKGVLPADLVPVFVDVTSIAELHIRALKSDDTIGKRVPLANGPASIYSILQIIKKNRPELVSRLPPTPDADAIADKPVAKIDTTVSKQLGLPGASLEDTVLQTVDSLVEWEKKLGN